MVIAQGDVWWADLGEPTGSAPGYRRPVLIVQADTFNQSRLATTLCVPLTSNLRWANTPGNVLLRAVETGLTQDSVANVSQMQSIDRSILETRAGRVPQRLLERVFAGVDLLLGR